MSYKSFFFGMGWTYLGTGILKFLCSSEVEDFKYFAGVDIWIGVFILAGLLIISLLSGEKGKPRRRHKK